MLSFRDLINGEKNYLIVLFEKRIKNFKNPLILVAIRNEPW